MKHDSRMIAVHLTGVTGLVAVLLVAYFLGIRARLNAEAMTASIQQKIASGMTSADALRQDIAMLEEEVRTLRTRADQTFHLRPLSSRNALLAELGERIRAAGITVDEMIPAGEEDGDGLVRVIIRLRAHGRLTDLLALMRTLRADRPDIAVRTLEVRGDPLRDDGEQAFSVQLVWFADPADGAGRNSG